MYYRSSLSVVNFRQVLLELCPFWNLEYWKYTVFRTFLLYALTYWVEILQMTWFYCNTDQVRVSSICVKLCRSYAPFGIQNTENIQFSAIFSVMLWLIELKFCTWLCFTEKKINFECCQFASIFWELCPFWNFEYLKYTVFHTFLFHALAYWAEIFHVTFFNVLQSLSVVTLCPTILSEI